MHHALQRHLRGFQGNPEGLMQFGLVRWIDVPNLPVHRMRRGFGINETTRLSVSRQLLGQCSADAAPISKNQPATGYCKYGWVRRAIRSSRTWLPANSVEPILRGTARWMLVLDRPKPFIPKRVSGQRHMVMA